MKIAFFSSVSFGTQGSPGTYQFIERCLDYFDLRVFAPLHGKRKVYKSKKIPLIPIFDLSSKGQPFEYLEPLLYFNPDIIYIFNFPNWYTLLETIAKYLPDKKFVFDIKSPLLAEGKRRCHIQESSCNAWKLLDSIVTLSEHNVSTWIPDCKIEPLVYPLSLNLSSFTIPNNLLGRRKCIKYVYIGVLHPQRKLDLLIEAFQMFASIVKKSVILDIYGSGPDEDRLRELTIENSNIEGVRFLGLDPHAKLISKLNGYDAGIAYVPYSLYNSSPSLKALEYIASGIPVIASDTEAHMKLKKNGFTIDYFPNNTDGIIRGLLNLYDRGFTKERISQNLQAIKKYDFDNVIKDFFIPLFNRLSIGKKKLTNTKRVHTSNNVELTTKKQINLRKQSNYRILYLGPLGFKAGVWETRAFYIFPNLFDPIYNYADIYMLTGRVPAFAKKTLSDLCKKYKINHIEARPKKPNTTPHDYWKGEISKASSIVKPDIITNIFAPATLGLAMVTVGKEAGSRVVLRVAGDEIGSRVAMGLYENKGDLLGCDLANEAAAYRMSDAIIVMSPWERERVCQNLSGLENDKVKICIRGIDLSLFPYKQRDYRSIPAKKYLFIGRRSLEKGYDILENTAKILFLVNKQIQFLFAGSFEKKNIENRKYLGWIDNTSLAQTFSKSDIFVLPSRSEGFPQVVAEAMATGLPCILPKHMFRDMLKNEKEALLSTLDCDAFSNAVLKLHNEPDLANLLSNESRKFAENKLNIKIWSERYRKILFNDADLSANPFSEFNLFKKQIITSGLNVGEIREWMNYSAVSRGKSKNNLSNLTVSRNEVLNPTLAISSNDRKSSITTKTKVKSLSIFFWILSDLNTEKTKTKLYGIINQFSKSNHLVYIAFPSNLKPIYSSAKNLVIIPYSSMEAVKYQVNHIDLDVLLFMTSRFDGNIYNSFLKNIKCPFLVNLVNDGKIFWKDNNISGTVKLSCLWEQEIFLSAATRIIVDKPPPISSQPNLIRYTMRNVTEFDQMEQLIIEVVESKTDPEQLCSDQFFIEPERAMHARRMRNKLLI